MVGPTGPTGPKGDAGACCDCPCVQQMLHLIQQIITLYPNDTLSIAMENGNNTSGRPGSLLPATNPGLFELLDSHGRPQEAVSVCRIASIRVTSAAYNDAITYLSAPIPAPQDCGASCEAAVRAYLPAGTVNASIKAGGQTVAQGTVRQNQFGVLVIVGPNNSNPAFVSTCKAEILEK